MGKLNWSALLLVAFGGLLLVVAWEGTHRKLWAAVTGQPQSSSTQGYSPFNPLTPDIIGSSAQQSQWNPLTPNIIGSSASQKGCSCPNGCEVGSGATRLPNGRCSICTKIADGSPC